MTLLNCLVLYEQGRSHYSNTHNIWFYNEQIHFFYADRANDPTSGCMFIFEHKWRNPYKNTSMFIPHKSQNQFYKPNKHNVQTIVTDIKKRERKAWSGE
jgi:hypothetical protein